MEKTTFIFVQDIEICGYCFIQIAYQGNTIIEEETARSWSSQPR